MRKYTQRFYATMDWFSVEEQPKSLKQLPASFQKAKTLWEKDKVGNAKQIIDLLQPFLGSLFLIDALSNWKTLFVSEGGWHAPEVLAESVRLISVDFAEAPIPRCKAEAYFLVNVKVDPHGFDFERWQDTHSRFYDAVSFFWHLKEENLRDVDFVFGDHSGVECIVVSELDLTPNIELLDRSEHRALHIYCPLGSPREGFIKFMDGWRDEVSNLSLVESSKSEQLELFVSAHQHQELRESLRRAISNGFLSDEITIRN